MMVCCLAIIGSQTWLGSVEGCPEIPLYNGRLTSVLVKRGPKFDVGPPGCRLYICISTV